MPRPHASSKRQRLVPSPVMDVAPGAAGSLLTRPAKPGTHPACLDKTAGRPGTPVTPPPRTRATVVCGAAPIERLILQVRCGCIACKMCAVRSSCP